MPFIRHPEFRRELETTKYPFSDDATLTNGQVFFGEGTFLDAALYPIGNDGDLYISSATVTHDSVTLSFSSQGEDDLALCEFDLLSPPSEIQVLDQHSRPAGVLVSEPERLAIFQSWGVGTFEFDDSMTEFVASVVSPVPQVGLRGILLEDGTLLTGDVWIVGEDGVVVRKESVTLPAACDEPAKTVDVIRIDVVGDPLFQRRLCVPDNLFETPRFLKSITFVKDGEEFTCGPDEIGNLSIFVGANETGNPALRLRNSDSSLIFEVGGTILET